MAWDNAVVGVFPLSIIMIVADEAVKRGGEALEIWLRLLESLALRKGHGVVQAAPLGSPVPVSQLKLLLIVVGLGVTGIAIRAAIVLVRLGHLRRKPMLLLVVNNDQLVDWEGAVDVFELGEHLVRLLHHLAKVHLGLRGTSFTCE